MQEMLWRKLQHGGERRPDEAETRGRTMVGWSGFQKILSEFHLSLVSEFLREGWMPSCEDWDGRRLPEPPFVRWDANAWAMTRARELARQIQMVERARREAEQVRDGEGDGGASSSTAAIPSLALMV